MTGDVINTGLGVLFLEGLEEFYPKTHGLWYYATDTQCLWLNGIRINYFTQGQIDNLFKNVAFWGDDTELDDDDFDFTQVQGDWNTTDVNSSSYIKNKPDIMEAVDTSDDTEYDDPF